MTRHRDSYATLTLSCWMYIQNRVEDLSSDQPAVKPTIATMVVLMAQALQAAMAGILEALRVKALNGCKIRGLWLRSSRPIPSQELWHRDSRRSLWIRLERDSRGSISSRQANLSLRLAPAHQQVEISVLSIVPFLHVRWLQTLRHQNSARVPPSNISALALERWSGLRARARIPRPPLSSAIPAPNNCC